MFDLENLAVSPVTRTVAIQSNIQLIYVVIHLAPHLYVPSGSIMLHDVMSMSMVRTSVCNVGRSEPLIFM